LFVPQLLHLVFFAFYIILLGRVIFSWVPISSRSPVLVELRSFCYRVTDPLLQPIRRLLAPYQRNSPVDFSPLVLYVMLEVARTILMRLVWFP